MLFSMGFIDISTGQRLTSQLLSCLEKETLEKSENSESVNRTKFIGPSGEKCNCSNLRDKLNMPNNEKKFL